MVHVLDVPRILVQVDLTQEQANALHHAIDEYLHARVFDDRAHSMHERVADALVAAGYEVGYTHSRDGQPGVGPGRRRPPHP